MDADLQGCTHDVDGDEQAESIHCIVSEKERERKKERQRETKKERKRERKKQKERERERERKRDRKRNRAVSSIVPCMRSTVA